MFDMIIVIGLKFLLGTTRVYSLGIYFIYCFTKVADLEFSYTLVNVTSGEFIFVCNDCRCSYRSFKSVFVLLLYVPSQQLWSLRDGQFT